jgi:hypothetical protein
MNRETRIMISASSAAQRTCRNKGGQMHSPSHGENTGSIPVGSAKNKRNHWLFDGYPDFFRH